MKLSQSQLKKLKQLDIVKATHEAREENYKLLNDQGFSILALIISNFIAEIAEHPEKLIEEFAS